MDKVCVCLVHPGAILLQETETAGLVERDPQTAVRVLAEVETGDLVICLSGPDEDRFNALSRGEAGAGQLPGDAVRAGSVGGELVAFRIQDAVGADLVEGVEVAAGLVTAGIAARVKVLKGRRRDLIKGIYAVYTHLSRPLYGQPRVPG